jgi:hypothetical protein
VIKLEEYAANVFSMDRSKVVIILDKFRILGEIEPFMRVIKHKPID